jgi:hypothetical protein
MEETEMRPRRPSALLLLLPVALNVLVLVLMRTGRPESVTIGSLKVAHQRFLVWMHIATALSSIVAAVHVWRVMLSNRRGQYGTDLR